MACLPIAAIYWITSIQPRQRGKDVLAAQLAAIAAGKTNSLVFYDTAGTDPLLISAGGSPQVQSLRLELTDISGAGLRAVGTFPNLQTLEIYGGRPGVDDAGLELLKDNPIRRLGLINTHVSDSGLAQLAEFGKLESLLLYRDGSRMAPLTDDGVLNLAKCRQLKELRLGGRLISDAAIADLRNRLPRCSVFRSDRLSF